MNRVISLIESEKERITNPELSMKTRYEYDTRGNWIKKVAYIFRNDKIGKRIREEISRSERRITYQEVKRSLIDQFVTGYLDMMITYFHLRTDSYGNKRTARNPAITCDFDKVDLLSW